MAGKTEFWSDEEIDYKEELLDRFSDTDLSKWKLRQHVSEYVSHFLSIDRGQNLKDVKFVPDVYLPNSKPGARSPLSVEAAQNMMNRLAQNAENSLVRETKRATSSEQYLSDFMEENMVTKKENQEITGHKKFNSTNTDYAFIDTEVADDIKTRHEEVLEDIDVDRDVNVQRDVNINRNLDVMQTGTFESNLEVKQTATINTAIATDHLKIPIGRPSNPQVGEIWFEV
jgi:hypothetical protein